MNESNPVYEAKMLTLCLHAHQIWPALYQGLCPYSKSTIWKCMALNSLSMALRLEHNCWAAAGVSGWSLLASRSWRRVPTSYWAQVTPLLCFKALTSVGRRDKDCSMAAMTDHVTGKSQRKNNNDSSKHRPENIKGMACIQFGGPTNGRANGERKRRRGSKRTVCNFLEQLEQCVFPIKA